MIINGANLALITQAVNLAFTKAYEAAPSDYLEKIATVVPSTTTEEIYPMVAEIPQFREWVGDRVANDIATYDYKLANRDWELTLKLGRNKVQDDQYGIWMQTVVPMVAQQGKRKPALLVRDQLRSGQSTLCYDGQNFFDASHPISKFPGSTTSGTQQNYWSSGKALNFANYQSVRATMMGFKGESGEALGVHPNLLIVPPQLEDVARSILKADLVAPATLGAAGATMVGGQSNVYKDSAELLVLPELAADATTWYLLDTSKPLKPFIYQKRQEPILVAQFNPNDESVYRRKEFEWGADMRGAAGVALWFLAAKAVG
jgi:phage major head subunit gpT-like protein